MSQIDDEEEGVVNVDKNSQVRVLTVCIGQGGSRLGISIAAAFDAKKECVFMNTSTKDLIGLELNSNELRTIKLGDEKEIEGAGKDRTVSEGILIKSRNAILEELGKIASSEAYDFIFVVFSTAGGTGSGVGPKLTAALNAKPFLDPITEKVGKRPLVFGIAALPEISTSEGNLSYENTLECLKDIENFVSKDVARYFLINNGAVSIKTKNADRIAQLNEINVSTASILKRYITQYGVSRTSNLDRADRYGAMRTMGIHAFELIEPNGERIQTPFFFPDGERVKRLCYEVPETMENLVLKAIASTGAICDDTTHGLFDPNHPDNSLTPIIAYHGYKNVSKIAEAYDKRLKLNRENARRIEKNNIYSATGLDDVENERAIREAEYGHKGASSFDDIFG